MKTIALTGLLWLFIACGKGPESSVEIITAPGKQDSLFKGLMTVIQNSISETQINDSLAFLVLPVQASCPSCRKKTIDSIMKYQASLAAHHYIIISANGGKKTMRGYFQQQDYELPFMKNKDQLFLDSNNIAYEHNLYKEKPTMYYAHDKKVYKKVGAIPATVLDDLREFFSGHRNPTE